MSTYDIVAITIAVVVFGPVLLNWLIIGGVALIALMFSNSDGDFK